MLRPLRRPALAALALACASAFPASAHAGVNAWTSSGPDGGTAYALAADPLAAGVVYAATPGGLWKSVDGGATWTRPSGDPVGVEDVAPDPHAAGTVYAATVRGGYRSVDGGVTWQPFGGAPGVGALRVVEPSTEVPGTVFASSFRASWRSTDGGATWTRLEFRVVTPRGSFALPAGASTFAFRPGRPNIAFAAVDGFVFRSTDGGATWTRRNRGRDVFTVYQLAAAPDGSRVLFAFAEVSTVSCSPQGCGGTVGPALLRSTDGAVTWRPVRDAVGTREVLRLATGGGSVYVTGERTLARTTDAGATWTRTALPAAANDFFLGRSLAVDAVDPDRLVVGSLGIPYRTTDAGATWQRATDGMRALMVGNVSAGAAGTIHAAGLDAGVARSTDGGATWGAAKLRGAIALALEAAPSRPRIVYALTALGVYRSDDGGTTWHPTRSRLGLSIAGIAVDPNRARTVYATAFIGSGRQLLRTVDGGRSWRVVGPQFRLRPALLVAHPTRSGVLYLVERRAVRRSDDGGRHWRRVDRDLPGSMLTLAVAPSRPGTVYAATSNGLYRSRDGAGHWTRVGGTASPRRVIAIAVDPAHARDVWVVRVTASGFSSTIRRSVDGGASWASAATGLDAGLYISDLLHTGSAVHAAAYGGSVWSYTID
jgi:photosystem II stability/assembly factor-like uncharacterized protein